MGQCLYDEGSAYKVLPIYDGAVYSMIDGDCVKGGSANEFAETHSASSLTMSIASGFGFIGGAYFTENAVNVELEASSNDLYIVARIDKTRTNGMKAKIECIKEVQIKKENLNGTGNVRDLLLYKVITDANGVSSVIDLRRIVNGTSLYIAELSIIGTPIQLEETEVWDLSGTYTHYLDVDVAGVVETDYISNIVLRDDFEGASTRQTLQNKIRFFFSSADAVDTKAFDVVLKGR